LRPPVDGTIEFLFQPGKTFGDHLHLTSTSAAEVSQHAPQSSIGEAMRSAHSAAFEGLSKQRGWRWS